ncbi:MAG: hypothetical protein A4E66_01863 [Syntrophus sp. PtaB.Bin001]|nr:MAG: hypothetical protein A4E66_01863 [Syntrophus sp. PtaB.Bin001]
MVINESQQKRLNEAKAEQNPQNRMIRMAVFICENCSDEVKLKVCDYMESQIAECLKSKEE